MNSYNIVSALKNQSEFSDDRNDCTVKAVALLCDVTYNVAHKACEEVGRKKNKGLNGFKLEEVFNNLGFVLVEIKPSSFIENYPKKHRTLQSVTTYHPRRFPKAWNRKGKFLLTMMGHVAAVVDGVVEDHTASHKRPVHTIEAVIKKEK